LIKEAAQVRHSKPCIFLSHKSEDKPAVKDIAKYIGEAGVDYYLDIEDPDLQKAERGEDHVKITEFIELGINRSSHVLSLISNTTKDSWWVPFEIGYAKKGEKGLALLPLKDVAYIPSYIQILRELNGIKQLNEYLEEIKKAAPSMWKAGSLERISESVLSGQTVSHIKTTHPLRKHLKLC
jgi:hypothetical protein